MTQHPPGPPVLWALIGPNGSGKSTYYRHVVRKHLQAVFVNADQIAKRHFPGDEVARSYDAARMAAEQRTELLEARRSFVMETVFSHPSKLAFLQQAKQRGYEVWVSLLYVASAELSVARVVERTRRGGHHVPHHKVRERYSRMRGYATQALRLAAKGWVVDNTDPRRPLRSVLQLEAGQVIMAAQPLPAWAVALREQLSQG